MTQGNDPREAVLAYLRRAGLSAGDPPPFEARFDGRPPQDEGSGAAREPVAGGSIRVNGRDIPQASDPETIEERVTAFCAELDQSDTDNGLRLLAHFGRNIRVLAQEKADKPLFVVWTGTHWDINQGRPRAERLCQRLGDRILAEIPFLRPTKKQGAVLEAAVPLREKPAEELSPADRRTLAEADRIEKGIAGARKQRRDFAISSKNSARLKSMKDCAAPHVITGPDDFNADHFKVAVENATLTFGTYFEDEVNPEAEREDAPEDVAPTIRVKRSRVRVEEGHRREDMISEIVPVAYDRRARCPKWLAFLGEFQPDPEVRKLVQVSYGIGLLGLTVQKLFFHYGNGANGKSVAMEVICRVLGEAAVTLPSSSFFGPNGQAGAASPDIARLYGRRLLRVKELPKDEPLKEDLVKELTGGETMTGRDLFAGYFDFQPLFVAHMSGNNYPKITGTDNGIWRRMTVILWPKTLEDARQRDFEEVVLEFMNERAGILNWLIEGALIYLAEGLQIPDSVRHETQKYRDEMDQTAAFVAAHIRPAPGNQVTARDLYNAYAAWASGNSVKPISETMFGKNMAKKFTRRDGRVRMYEDIMLFDPPEFGAGSGGDYPPGYGGG